MKRALLFLFLFISFIFAKEYEIVVATLRYKSGIDKIKKEFKKDKILVYRKGEFFVITVGIFDENEVRKKLKEIKKLYPSAFVREIGKRKKESVKKVETKKEEFVIQIAVLSKKEGIKKIKEDLLGIDVKVGKAGKFYKIFATAFSKDEAHRLLKRIKEFYPSAFIVGEKRIKPVKKFEKKGNRYIIFVSAFKDNNDSVLLDFPNEENYLKKEGKLNYFYIVNIQNLDEAKEKLQNIKNKYPFAKIVSSIDEKIELNISTDEKERFLKEEKNLTKKVVLEDRNETESKSAAMESNLSKEAVKEEDNASKGLAEENESVQTPSKSIEEVMPGDFKEVDENVTKELKIKEEVIVKRYDEKKEPSINSEIIRRVRKNYIDIAKPADEIYK